MIECVDCEMLLSDDEIVWEDSDAYCDECYRKHIREVSDFIEGDEEEEYEGG